MNGAFSWGVLRNDVVQPGMAEREARALAAETGGRLVRVQYVYPSGKQDKP